MGKIWKQGMIAEGMVQKLAFGGKGIVREENFVIFIKGALPGQEIRFQIQSTHENFAEAKLLQVLTLSPLEIVSPYEPIPGCVFQNVRYEDQLRLKEEQVYEALDHLAKIDYIFERLPILPSPQIIRYRNKVELSFGYERMRIAVTPEGRKIFHDENPVLGFHPEGNWALVQSFRDCFLISEQMNLVHREAELIMQSSKLPVWNPKTARGFWRSLILRESVKTSDILMNFIVTENPETSFWQPVVRRLVTKIPQISGILTTVHTGRSDLPPNLTAQTLFGKDFLTEQLEDTVYQISPFAFFQTNTRGAEQLFRVVREFSELTGKEKVLDLFCGSGAIGLFLADKAAKVIGLERDERAIVDARTNAQKNNYQHVEYISGKVEDVLPRIFELHPSFDVILVDPPRTGLHPKALKFLLNIPVQRMIYVSCNPTTLARDLSLLNIAEWKVAKIQPIDMFPHTPHIEVVVQLKR